MDVGLFVAIAGLVVGGIAALLGVWDPELDRYVSEELRAQTRANPGVVNELAGRVAARGQTIETVLARRGLGAADLEAMGFQPMERASSP